MTQPSFHGGFPLGASNPVRFIYPHAERRLMNLLQR